MTTPRPLTLSVAGKVRYWLVVSERGQAEPGRGAAKLARLMGWPYSRARAVYKGTRDIAMDEVEEIAAKLDVDVLCFFDDGSRAPATSDGRPGSSQMSDDDHEQCRAFGRLLAKEIWMYAGEDDFIDNFVLNEEFNLRAPNSFWTRERLLYAARSALSDLALVIGKRYPLRDQFLLRDVLPPEKMIGGPA
ncbi:hypothetical protein DEU37_1887 [Microbacterium sp. AG790]|uniref:hypothetical protein n=1 Tax=Microbacterium sp. AG790 TaxID=2183995 RepID=UPI000F162FD7|nr:hypothetical protein [Microbacterium sp. AG790]RKS89571.1 hypothetical protein DEU37_1887 [Microbacterium sp. AG790]